MAAERGRRGEALSAHLLHAPQSALLPTGLLMSDSLLDGLDVWTGFVTKSCETQVEKRCPNHVTI